MRITSDTVADGIREQLFTVGDIPGVLWTPAEGSGPRPLVLIGHAGGQHNPGSHFEVPDFEIDSSIRFFARHLDSQGAAM